jgi:hypothetical protein
MRSATISTEIFWKNMANFQPPRNGRNLSTITTHPTTTTPQKHHTKTPLFPKPPSKNATKQTKIPLSGTAEKISEKTGLGLKNGLEK